MEEVEEYTPSTTAARVLYQSGRVREVGSSWLRDDYGAEFDRWLAAHDAQVKAEALREAATAYTNFDGDNGSAMVARRWLRARAAETEGSGR